MKLTQRIALWTAAVGLLTSAVAAVLVQAGPLRTQDFFGFFHRLGQVIIGCGLVCFLFSRVAQRYQHKVRWATSRYTGHERQVQKVFLSFAVASSFIASAATIGLILLEALPPSVMPRGSSSIILFWLFRLSMILGLIGFAINIAIYLIIAAIVWMAENERASPAGPSSSTSSTTSNSIFE